MDIRFDASKAAFRRAHQAVVQLGFAAALVGGTGLAAEPAAPHSATATTRPAPAGAAVRSAAAKPGRTPARTTKAALAAARRTIELAESALDPTRWTLPAGGRPANGIELSTLQEQLAAADGTLAAALARAPQDTALLLLQARLDHVKFPLHPAVLGAASGVAVPPAPDREAGPTLEALVAAQPRLAEAWSLLARWHASDRTRSIAGGALSNTPPDLAQAVLSARRAVEAQPTATLYREQLAVLLARRHEHDAARAVLRPEVPRERALAALVGDLDALPLPDGTRLNERLTDDGVRGARGLEHAALRLRVVNVPLDRVALEAFLRERFPGLVAREAASRGGGGFAVNFEERDGRWVPVALPAGADHRRGFHLQATEYRGLNPAQLRILDVAPETAASGAFCIVTLASFRELPRP